MRVMATRICRRCKEERDLEEHFYASLQSRGGRNTICKRCIQETRAGNPRYFKIFTCGGCGIEYQRMGRTGSWSLCAECLPKGKVCGRCKQFKPFERFHTGLNRYCRDGCDIMQTRERRYGLAPGTGEASAAQPNRPDHTSPWW